VSHPHPSREHIARSYRQYILGCIRKYGTARSQVHYRDLLNEYLAAKRDVVAAKSANCGDSLSFSENSNFREPKR
jgi:hypothetical protein